MRRFIVVMLMWYSASVCLASDITRDELIRWLAKLPEQGIEVSPKHWLVLSQNPSPQDIQAIAREYAGYIDRGQLNKQYYQPGWTIADQPVLNNSPISSQSFKTVQSKIPAYPLLIKALANLRHWRQQAAHLFPDDLILFEGDEHPAVGRLNQWLEDLDLAHGLPEQAYSQKHKDVLTDVQLKYELMPDGRLGALTRQALLSITNQRIRTLKANLERIRWLPRELPYPHIQVDIPGYAVGYVTAPLKVQRHKAIIGSRQRQTPIFQDEVESVTINPVWKVPHSIAARNMLRAEKKEPGFFRKEGFKVYKSWDDHAPEVQPESVNWQALTPRTFLYRLEQQPGELNRLGKLKLDLPNSHGVYLHDTNKPELFEKTERSLSSGCTRVRGIDLLVRRIALEQGVAQSFHQHMASSETQKLKLKQEVPIYFMYFTAWPDDNGRVRFREDIYKLDNALTSRF